MKRKRLAIIGCGLIGAKRAVVISRIAELAGVYDKDPKRASDLAHKWKCEAFSSVEQVLGDPNIDAVVIATTHDSLAALCEEALRKGKHVLIEKPGARNASELAPVLALAERVGLTVKVGFNHRFHPAIMKARELIDTAMFGPLMYIRANYGHGGRLGYDKEWRANPEISGGGELLDQGCHLLDLCQFFIGDEFKVKNLSASLKSLYWNMPVEDNAFLQLNLQSGSVAQLHVTWTEWKNSFSFELAYRTVKLHIQGLGGSYGTERLSFYQMRPEMGPPDTTIWEFPAADESWERETEEFIANISSHEPRSSWGANLRTTYELLDLIDRIYKQAGFKA